MFRAMRSLHVPLFAFFLADDNIIDTTVKEVNPASQEIEFLTPPDILTIDDKEAVAERTGDSPIEMADGGADDVSPVIEEVTDENDPPGSDSSAPVLPEQEEEDEDVAMADDSQTTIIAAVDVSENALDDVTDHTQDDEAGEGSNEVEDDEGGSDQVADDQAAGDEVADDVVVDDRKADDEIVHDNKVDNAVVSDDMIVQDAESV